MHEGATAMLLAVQAPAPPAEPPVMLTPPPPGIVILPAIERCPRAAGSEIVVCGRRDADERHRVRGIAHDDPDAPRGPPGIQLSDSVRAEVDVSQILRSDGFVDRRVVLRFRIAF